MRKSPFLTTAALLGLGALILASCTLTRAGYETAPFAIVSSEAPYEIRDYPELKQASTPMKSAQGPDSGFMKLFNFISGKNQANQKISMTTPVFMDGTGTDKAKMAFVMPDAVAKTGVPAAASADVVVETRAAARCAVYRFSGERSDKAEAEAKAKLEAWAAAKNLKVVGPAFFAYYDPPFTPSALRKNEVLLPIAK